MLRSLRSRPRPPVSSPFSLSAPDCTTSLDTPSLYGWDFDAIGVNADHVQEVLVDRDVVAVAQYRGEIPLRVKGQPTIGYSMRGGARGICPSIVTGHEPAYVRNQVALGADTMATRPRSHRRRTEVSRGSKGRCERRRCPLGTAGVPDGHRRVPADGAIVDPDAVFTLGPGDSFVGLAVVRGGADADAHDASRR